MRRACLLAAFAAFAAFAALTASALPVASAAAQGTSQPTPGTAAPSVDPTADAVLRRIERRLKGLRSIHARYEHVLRWPDRTDHTPAQRLVYSASLAKPNLALVLAESFEEGATGEWVSTGRFTDAGTGKAEFRVLEDKKTYTTRTAAKDRSTNASGLLPLRGFYAPDSAPATMFANRARMGDRCTLDYLGRQTWEGAEYDVVRMHFAPPEKERLEKTVVLWVGADDLIHRWQEAPPKGDTVYETAEWVLRDVVVDAPVAAADFAYTPPADATLVDASAARRPLAPAAPAPAFTAMGRDGKPLRLSDYRGKVVLLDFWATWCGPCIASFPHTAGLAERYGKKDIVVLALDISDDRTAFDSWLQKNPRYGALRFALAEGEAGREIARAYRVRAIPLRYVIDRSGRIVASEIGFDTKSKVLEAALRKALSSPAQGS